VIDPGWDAPAILSEIQRLGLKIKYVLNTHGHWYVSAANAAVVQATGAQLAIHSLDMPLLHADGDAELWDIEVESSPEPDVTLKDGQVLPIGQCQLKVLHTPGHTPGHVSFHEDAVGVVFAGDTLNKDGLGRYDLPRAHQDDLVRSVKNVLMLMPADTPVYPSRGPMTTIGQACAAAGSDPSFARPARGRSKGFMSRFLRLALGLSGLAIFAIILYLGGTQALSRVAHGDPRYLFATLLAIGGITLIGALRWRLLVGALTRQPLLPVHQIYHYNIVGRFISLFAPRGVGDFAGRPLALRAGAGSSLGIALYSTVLDRVFDYLLMLVMTGPALLYVGRVVSVEVGATLTAILVVVFFVVIATRFGQFVGWLTAFLGWVAAQGSRVPVLGRLVPQKQVDRLRQLKHIEISYRVAGSAYLLTILQMSMVILRSYLIARALGLYLSFPLLLLAAPVAQLGQLFAFTPGALGIRELSWFGVLQTTGIPQDDLLAFLVGHRAYIYVCILLLATISQLILLIRPKRAPSLQPAVGVEQPKT
jgi:uncharacterized protein (TIRG00374 family)